MDSWYTGTHLIEEVLSKGYYLAGGVKPNRKISPCGIKLKILEFTQYIKPSDLDVVIVKDKEYRIYQHEGNTTSFDNAVLLISYEVTEDGF